LGISVAVRCAPCVAYHAQGALKHGASREAIAETLALAIYMGAGPSIRYAAEALEAVDQLMAKSAGPE
jgi:AhpD family alkylhydroperoxidase